MKIKTIGDACLNYKDEAVWGTWKRLCQKTDDGEIVPVTLVKSGTDFDYFGDGRIDVICEGVKLSSIPTGYFAPDYADYTYIRELSQLLTAESTEAVVVQVKNRIRPVIEVKIED